MKILARQPRTVVVDFSRGSIKMAVAETAAEAVRFRGITRIPLPSQGDGDEAQVRDETSAIVEAIRAEVLRRGWGGMPAACLLSGAATSTQSFAFPPMPAEDMRQAIALRLEKTLHFDVAEACFDFRPLREQESGGNREVLTLVAAARRQEVQRGLDMLRAAGLDPVAIGAASESLATLSYFASPCGEDEATIHVDIGRDSTILNLFEGRLLRFSREIEVGGEAFVQALLRPILTDEGAVQLDREQAEAVLAAAGYPLEGDERPLPHGVRASEVLPLMEPVAQRLTAEIERSIDYLGGILGRAGIDRVVLSGSAGSLGNLDAILAENLDTPVQYVDPVGRAVDHWRLSMCGEKPESVADFSAILGFSLGNRRPLNLLPREERVARTLRSVSRVRRAVAPIAATVAILMGMAVVRIDSMYGRAVDLLESASGEMDTQLRSRDDVMQGLEGARRVAQRVADERGVVPHWSGLMKELAHVFPPEAQVDDLGVEWVDGVPVLSLSVQIHPGAEPFDVVSTHMAVSLTNSPFFRRVRVTEASASDHGSGGHFEATMELVSRPTSSWSEPR